MHPIAPGAEEYVYLEPHPFLFQFPEGTPLIDGIRFYGLAYLIGFVIAWFLLRYLYRAGVSPLDDNKRSDFLLYLIVGVMAGGRLGYMLLYNFGDLMSDPLSVFRVWEGGMASHGGFVGVMLGALIFAKQQRVSFLRLTDLCVLVATPGIFLGRIANFLNGELWGDPSWVPWAIVFSESTPSYLNNLGGYFLVPRHPSQLYAAGLEGCVVGVWLWWRFFSRLKLLRAGELKGLLASEFLIVYGLCRILGEQFRAPDASLIELMSVELRRGTFYSLLMLGLGIALRISVKRQKAT